MSDISKARLKFSEREARILTAAAEVFSELGFRGATTRQIAAQAGINEALLFRHFKNKEELYAAALQFALQGKNERLLPSLEEVRKLPLAKALLTLSQRLLQENRDDPRLVRMLLFSGLEHHALTQGLFSQNLPLFAWLEDFFRERIKAGEVRRMNVGLLAQMFLSLVHHYILMTDILHASWMDESSDAAVLRFYTKIFCEGGAV